MEHLNDGMRMPRADQLSQIRLVVSDLDGTLLDGSKQVPASFPKLVQRLASRGILFATASGRNWIAQENFFSACKDQIAFVCDNGACLMYEGKPLFISALAADLWKEIAEKCETYDGDCAAILCGVKGAYMKRTPKVQEIVDEFYAEMNYIDGFDEVDDQIFKVSVCYRHGVAGSFSEDFQESFSDRSNVVCAHRFFLDVMNPGINKAAGVRLLQQHLGLTSSQTMAFGDYDNDIELLQEAGIAFIMENAPLEMRQHADFVAPSNEEEGVITTIEKCLLA